MAYFKIKGGKKLKGEIKVNGAKNCALKIIVASLLSKEEITIKNVPQIEEINRLLELCVSLGSVVSRDGDVVKIKTEKLITTNLDPVLVKKIRVSVLLLGVVLLREGRVHMPHPGGCAIGKRPIDLFISGLQKLGATVVEDETGYTFKAEKLQGAEIFFPIISVTGTEFLMMTATLAKGRTILKNCACEPEIPALAEYLNSCGARISGAGTNTIIIDGVDSLSADVFEVIPDRVEAGSFAILGALCGDPIRVINCVPGHLESLLAMFEKMGVPFSVGKDWIEVKAKKEIKTTNVVTHEYPGFITDLASPFVILLTQSEGMSLFHETIFEGRLFFSDMLVQMGAKIVMCDPHRIIINGPTELFARRLDSPDLRAGFALVLAGLIAKGETILDNIYQIDRGYEKIEERLQMLGAEIERVNE